MPLTIQYEVKDAQIAGRGSKDGTLELIVGSAGGPFTRKTCCL